MMKIKKNDMVIVLAGRDKGKTGKVLSVSPKAGKVLVDGINVVKRHQKADAMGNKSGIVEKLLAIDISNVAIRDPKTGKPTRVGIKKLADGKKVRVAKKSGEVIDK